jgi:hypothetical protein
LKSPSEFTLGGKSGVSMFSMQSGKTNNSAPELRKETSDTIEERKGRKRKRQVKIKFDKTIKKKNRP